MCSKADTNAIGRLLRCGHRRLFFTLKCHRPSSAQTSHAQRLDAESACPETATLWLGHQPGIGDAAGKSIPPGAGFGTVCRCPRFWASKPTTCSRATCAARSKSLRRFTASNSHAARFRRQPKIHRSKHIFSSWQNNCRSNTAYKKVSQRQSRKDLQLLICEET